MFACSIRGYPIEYANRTFPIAFSHTHRQDPPIHEHQEISRLSDYRLGILQLLCGAFMISFSPVFVKLANVGPTIAGFYRNFIGAIFLLFVVWVRREALWRGRRPLAMACGCGLLFALDLSFWHRSIHYIGPGLATIMGNFQVFFLAAFGIAVFHEKPDWKFLVAVPLALLGLFMLVGPDWSALDRDYRLGLLCGLVTAVTYAFYVLLLQRSQSDPGRLAATANLAVISLAAAAIMGVEARALGEGFRIPDAQSGWSLIAYGVLCQALGWIVISRGLVKIPASRAGLILLLQPTLAFLWDVFFFSRPTNGFDALGAVLALGAIYLGGARRRK
jgi:drug/metabolite transporter (DMT)-like permease